MFAMPLATTSRSELARSHPAWLNTSRLSTLSGIQSAGKPNDSIAATASASSPAVRDSSAKLQAPTRPSAVAKRLPLFTKLEVEGLVHGARTLSTRKGLPQEPLPRHAMAGISPRP